MRDQPVHDHIIRFLKSNLSTPESMENTIQPPQSNLIQPAPSPEPSSSSLLKAKGKKCKLRRDAALVDLTNVKKK